jgi:hypothetical protein
VWGDLLRFNPTRFQSQLRNWRDAIVGRGAPPNAGIVAFIDGTLRKTCAPTPASSAFKFTARFICLIVCLFVCSFVCLTVYLSDCLTVRLFGCFNCWFD